MNHFARYVIGVLLLAGTFAVAYQGHSQAASPSESGAPPELVCLAKVYQGGVATNLDNTNSVPDRYLILADHTKILWDDHLKKTFEEKLEHPDLEDTFSIPYRSGDGYLPLRANHDPGRIRSLQLLKSVYGATAEQVKRNLVPITWAPSGRRILFNRQFGAASALERAGKTLSALPDTKRFVNTLSGTFKWRMVKDTHRLSAHSFGIAVDIDTRHSDYWKWGRKLTDPLPYRNRIPMSVVHAFEEQGFVWGGKWYHYDTMHFEYRPELLCATGNI